MQINGTSALTGAQRIAPSNHTASVASSAPLAEGNANSMSVRDEINLRETSSMAGTNQIHGVCSADGEVRMDLVNRIRSQIAAGTYETEEKLDIALNKLLDELESF